MLAATYYIDYAGGSDGNNGTATNTPWQHSPYMQGWSGSYSHANGDVEVFKRGVTWPNASLGMVITVGGSDSSHPDIYESLPIWTINPTNLYATFDAELTILSSASVITVGADNVTIKGIEVKNQMIPNADYPGYNAYACGGIAATYNTANYLTVQDCWIHDWQPAHHNDSDYGGLFFYGIGTAIHNIIGPGIGQGGNAAMSSGCGIGGGCYTIVSNNIFHCYELINAPATEISHNDLGNAPNGEPNSHCNIIYHDYGSWMTVKIYDNKIHDVGDQFQTMLLHVGISGVTNTTTYIYNNVIWNVSSAIVFDDFGITYNSNGIVAHVWNNLFQTFGSTCVASGNRNGGSAQFVYEVDCQNNVWITDGGYGHFNPFGDYNENNSLFGNMTIRIDQNNLWLAPSNATTLGWTLANQWQTPSITSTNVGYGTNLTVEVGIAGLPTADILGNARPSSGPWDAGAYQFFITPTTTTISGILGRPQ